MRFFRNISLKFRNRVIPITYGEKYSTRYYMVGDSATMHRGHEKIGRNEPCACGSGMKYKACHGIKQKTRFERLMYWLFKI